MIFYDSTPDLFKKHLIDSLEVIKDKQDEHKILFLRAWNEWGEGNYLEPDAQYGRQYLDVMREVIISRENEE